MKAAPLPPSGPAAEAPTPLQGPRVGILLAERFRVLEVIGRGGMGIVVRAFDKVTKTEVAVKHVRPDLGADPDYADRLLREASLARDVSHPNICRVHDVYRHGDEVLLSMEYVAGENLRKRLDRGGVSDKDALSIARQICAGVAAAHEQGVVHRDLKPENVLIDATGRVVVLDFGVARREGTPRDTVTGIALGTPRYMSPEQQQGKAVTPASDVYALGLVIEELFGERKVPSWLRPIIRRATERDPGRRPRDAKALGRLLSRPWLSTRLLYPVAGVALLALAVWFVVSRPRINAPPEPAQSPQTQTIISRSWSGALFGTVSPDGKMLAYIEENNGVQEGLLRPLRDVAAQPLRFSLGGQTVTWLSFAPDSRRIAYSTGHHYVDRNSVIYLVDISSPTPGAPKMVTQGTTPGWFPNGEDLVFSRNNLQTGRWHLARISVSDLHGGTSSEIIETRPPARTELAPEVSPDGKEIAYVAGPIPGGLRVVPVQGGDVLTLDELPEFYERVQWTRDSKRIIYLTSQNGGLLSVPVNGRGPRKLLIENSAIPHHPSLTSDGKLLVYTRMQEIFEVWVADRDGKNSSKVRVNVPSDTLGWPLYSPDGQAIAMEVGSSAQRQVMVIPLSGDKPAFVGQRRQVALPESFVFSGRALIIGSNQAGELRIESVDPKAQIPKLTFGMDEVHASVSPDESLLATTRLEGPNGTSAAGLWVRKLTDPPESATCWVDDGLGRATWSPDGKSLAIGTSTGRIAFSSGPNTTRRVELRSPQGTPIKTKLLRYAPDGKLLIADYPNIYEVDPETQVVTTLVSPKRIANLFGFSISPKGQIAYVVQPTNSDLWLVEAVNHQAIAQNLLR